MWTTENRGVYDRRGLRYPSDLTDGEWALVAPQIPPAKHGGRKRSVNVREVLNAIFYVLSTGCQWRALPKDFPPRSTVHEYLELWNWDGTLLRIHHTLYVELRERAGRGEASPSVAIIDSQSAKGAEKGGPSIDPSGYDAGKKVKGKKRHILVDTLGLLLMATVHPADIQDRDGAVPLLKTVRRLFPFLVKIIGDGAYQGPQLAAAARAIADWQIEVVKRSDQAKGFVVLPKRWIVERTFAWLGRCRRLAKDFENRTRNALAFLLLASIRLMVRRLAKLSP
ncbi:MAG: IS5 family transposase [Alphaproteobacteria bacterium]|nr:IS5 family transposase [Alphaproteobacteria bacterium]